MLIIITMNSSVDTTHYTSVINVSNTTFNKEIYQDFKLTCKDNGYFVKHVIMAFMEKFASRNFVLEFTDITDVKEK